MAGCLTTPPNSFCFKSHTSADVTRDTQDPFWLALSYLGLPDLQYAPCDSCVALWEAIVLVERRSGVAALPGVVMSRASAGCQILDAM